MGTSRGYVVKYGSMYLTHDWYYGSDAPPTPSLTKSLLEATMYSSLAEAEKGALDYAGNTRGFSFVSVIEKTTRRVE